MIKAIFAITKEPFNRQKLGLLTQQQHISDIVKIHAGQGGFSVVIGEPGVGKSVLREHIEQWHNERDTTVISMSRTMHTYVNILKQFAAAFKLDVAANVLETELIKAAFDHVRQRKTLYLLIDEAHLLHMDVLRKLRLLFERFPKKHNLVLFGQPDLLHYLSLTINQDIKSRITFSQHIKPLNDDDLTQYIINELEVVKMGINTFDCGAVEVIVRASNGNLRLCRNLCYASLIEACREANKIVTISHVNQVLIQPHWRSHDELIKQQVKP
jgi:type II secretory pathway predicted ATPase ExeA